MLILALLTRLSFGLGYFVKEQMFIAIWISAAFTVASGLAMQMTESNLDGEPLDYGGGLGESGGEFILRLTREALQNGGELTRPLLAYAMARTLLYLSGGALFWLVVFTMPFIK